MEKEFDEVYDKIIQNDSCKVVNPIKTIIIAMIVIIALSFGSIYLFKEKFNVLIILFFIVYIIFIIYFMIEQNKYSKNFRNKIVRNIVKQFNSNFNYETKYDIGVWNYRDSKLPEKFDSFFSRDGIYGGITDDVHLKMAYINTNKKIVEKNNGDIRTENLNTFYGIFGFAVVNKNVKTAIQIRSNDIRQNYNKKRIELESAEFEKKFDCFADDKIVALQVLTPDTIESIVEIHNVLKAPMEISIINNIIYYRILLKDIFNPPKFGNPMEKAVIKNIYDVVSCSQKLTKVISSKMMDI